MFGGQAYTRDDRCACGRAPHEQTLTTYRSISGTYLFHRCPCGIAWTEHRADPEHPGPPTSTAVREVHEHFQAFHGLLRELARARPTLAWPHGPTARG